MKGDIEAYLKYPTCPDTGKRSFETKKIPAEFREWTRGKKRGRLRVYLCKYAKHYHLTSWS